MTIKMTAALLGALCLLGAAPAEAQRYGVPYGQPWEGGPGYPPPQPYGDLPPGSYKATCRHIRFDGRTLTAHCRAVTGEWVPTGLDYGSCGGWVENVDSQLVCRGRGRRY